MGKVVFWLVLVFAVLFVLRLVNTAKARKARDDAPRPGEPARVPMVRCVECGVFLPQVDALAGPQGPRCGDAQCKERARRPH
jgi:hypothetical protein